MTTAPIFRSMIAVAGLLATFGDLLAQAPPTSAVESDDRPVCTEEQLASWRFANEQTQRVTGRDRLGGWIGDAPAKRRWVGKNWHPIDGYKHTVCGRLHRFGLFAPGALVGTLIGREEADWNNYVIPRPEFQYLIDDVMMFQKPTAQWKECDGKRCIEAEVTPPDGLFDNPWFSAPTKRDVSSRLVGQDVCFYGPWVFEEVHHSRPEIHPSELVWWSEPLDGGQLQQMLVIEDDSERFATAGDFQPLADSQLPSGWRAWAASPRDVEFLMAFDVASEPTTSRHYFLELDRSYSPGTEPSAAIATPRTLRYRQRPAVILNAPDSPDLTLDFAEICRRPDASLQGYVSVRTSVGGNGAEPKQFRAIRAAIFDRTEPEMKFAGFPAHPARRAEALTARLDKNSLRRIVENGQPKLVVALDVISTAALQADTISGGKQRSLLLDPSVADSVRIDNLSAMQGAEVILRASDGGATSIELPQVQLLSSSSLHALPSALRAVPTTGPLTQALWRASASVDAGSIAAAGLVWRRTGVVELSLDSIFAARRSDDQAAGEDSPISDLLNDAIEKRDEESAEAYFGSGGPSAVEWRYTARDLITGEEIPVNTGATGDRNAVRIDSIAPDARRLRVSFPDRATSLIEVTAHAVVTDAYGTKSELRQLIYDHELTDADPKRLKASLVSLLGRLAGVEPAAWSRAILPDQGAHGSTLATAVRDRRIRMLDALASRVSDDRTVSVGELGRIIGMAKQLGQGEAKE